MSAALQILQTTFGFTQFREPQQAIIEAVVAGNDAFVLMPTGGGKSLCYQLPALHMHRWKRQSTIVVSPLISLMQECVVFFVFFTVIVVVVNCLFLLVAAIGDYRTLQIRDMALADRNETQRILFFDF